MAVVLQYFIYTCIECLVQNWQGLWCCNILSTDVLNGRGRERLFVVNHFLLAEVWTLVWTTVQAQWTNCITRTKWVTSLFSWTRLSSCCSSQFCPGQASVIIAKCTGQKANSHAVHLCRKVHVAVDSFALVTPQSSLRSSLDKKLTPMLFTCAGKITESDIQRVAHRMLRCKPAVAAYGTLEQLPRYSDIEAALSNKNGRMPRRFLLFRWHDDWMSLDCVKLLAGGLLCVSTWQFVRKWIACGTVRSELPPLLWRAAEFLHLASVCRIHRWCIGRIEEWSFNNYVFLLFFLHYFVF